tara:strand:+ start:59 stop:292 length:234 start_codon:yes stop_codon:yes gene_type:complete
MEEVKLTKEQEILFEVYDKGVQNEDCDLDAYVEKMKQALSIAFVSQRYTIDDIERCVENWGLCKVEKEHIEKFLNGG